MGTIQLLLLDDHTLFRAMLSRLLETESAFRVVAHCSSSQEALEALGTHHIDLVLLDYGDRRTEAYGVYVGMSKYPPAQRFDQHKAGIRAAGSVLKRGLEVLTGPTLHLQWIRRRDAERIEIELAEALAEAGLMVKGGH